LIYYIVFYRINYQLGKRVIVEKLTILSHQNKSRDQTNSNKLVSVNSLGTIKESMSTNQEPISSSVRIPV
jgi:hypothetical protein